MQGRQDILRLVADALLHVPGDSVTRVAIDGVDGAGKSYFAGELADVLEVSGRSVIRASVDGFHNRRAVRYRKGKSSPEGFFHDSYDYDRLRRLLLDPLSPGGSRLYRASAFDHRTDRPTQAPELRASPADILIFDGIFLHRPELRGYWDYSIFLDVAFEVSVPRGAQRDGGSPDPHAPENHRYVAGQKIYLSTCDPKRHATIVINNDDLAEPYVILTHGSRSPFTDG